MSKYLITQIKSTIGTEKKTRENLKSLGLKKINSTVTVEKNASTEGLVKKVLHLVKVEVVK